MPHNFLCTFSGVDAHQMTTGCCWVCFCCDEWRRPSRKQCGVWVKDQTCRQFLLSLCCKLCLAFVVLFLMKIKTMLVCATQRTFFSFSAQLSHVKLLLRYYSLQLQKDIWIHWLQCKDRVYNGVYYNDFFMRRLDKFKFFQYKTIL